MYLKYEQIALTAGALDSTSLTIPTNATGAELQADAGGAISYTLDGTTVATGAAGMAMRTTDPLLVVLIEDLKRISFIKASANTKLNVHYFAGRNI